MNWIETDSYLKKIINNIKKLPDPVRIAGFDLDDTLIQRSKPNNQLKLVDPSINKKIAELVLNEYIIVIFTNQAGMSVNKNFDKNEWKKKIKNLIKILVKKIKNDKYYFAIYASKKYDLNRKPNVGMWNLMKEDLKNEFDLKKLKISKKSFYCGDAAGRISAGPFKKKIYPTSLKGDFSDTDRKFALNIGINFYTPEDLFMDHPPEMPYKLEGFNPNIFLENLDTIDYQFKPRKKEMIVMVGLPGSGKTEFVKKYILPFGYVHINQDTCGTKKKCLELTQKALDKGKSIVIDNTNPDVLSRMTYTMLAKDYNYKHIRCIIISTNVETAKHLNNVRHIYSNGLIPKITDIVYRIFKKNYIKPSKSENFDKIEIINFYFDMEKLDDPNWDKIFMKWSES